MDDTPIVNKLKELVRIYKTQKEAARHITKPGGEPISEQFLSDLLKGRRPIPEWLAEVFSYRAEWIYYPLMQDKKKASRDE